MRFDRAYVPNWNIQQHAGGQKRRASAVLGGSGSYTTCCRLRRSFRSPMPMQWPWMPRRGSAMTCSSISESKSVRAAAIVPLHWRGLFSARGARQQAVEMTACCRCSQPSSLRHLIVNLVRQLRRLQAAAAINRLARMCSHCAPPIANRPSALPARGRLRRQPRA